MHRIVDRQFAKNVRTAVAVVALLFVFGCMPAPARADTVPKYSTGLTEPQVLAITGLLASFNADPQMIARVGATLRGNPSSYTYFSASPTTGLTPLTVSFNAYTGNISYFGGYSIDYGDGTPATSCGYGGTPYCPSHIYTQGRYSAHLYGIGEGPGAHDYGTVRIVVTSTTDPLPPCPLYTLPVCNGSVIPMGFGNDGCPLPPQCVDVPPPDSCPAVSPCQVGYTSSTTVDSRGCTVLQCTPIHTCPAGSTGVYPACVTTQPSVISTTPPIQMPSFVSTASAPVDLVGEDVGLVGGTATPGAGLQFNFWVGNWGTKTVAFPYNNGYSTISGIRVILQVDRDGDKQMDNAAYGWIEQTLTAGTNTSVGAPVFFDGWNGGDSSKWLTPGVRYARVCIDADNAVLESNESNNCGPWDAFTVVPKVAVSGADVVNLAASVMALPVDLLVDGLSQAFYELGWYYL